MLELNKKQQTVLLLILEKGIISSSEVHEHLEVMGEHISLVTVKRMLSEMVDEGILMVQGAGPSTRYEISSKGRIIAPIAARQYCAMEPDNRYGSSGYNSDILAALSGDIFTGRELQTLKEATAEYQRRITNLPLAIAKKELERLIIELSWKSSKIEGNTYTLLDTEKLIRQGQEAKGHAASEARMILNHKDAFTLVHGNPAEFRVLTRKNLETLHALIVKDLNVGLGLRTRPVGILGSKYQPLDNIHQITDAIEALTNLVASASTPYAKALVALLGISYIQPFEDGNKRTSRLMANALLLAHGCAPLSYRSVSEDAYREAMLVWYELNSIIPFKNIFVAQYDFAARNYLVATP